jgi:hypothetical protein
LQFEENKEERSGSMTVTDLEEPTFSFKNDIDGDVEQLKAYKQLDKLRRKRKKVGNTEVVEEFSKECCFDHVAPSYDFLHDLFDNEPVVDYQK